MDAVTLFYAFFISSVLLAMCLMAWVLERFER